MNVLNTIMENKIIAIVRGIGSDKMKDLGQALLNGNIKCIEVTFRPASKEESLDTLKSIKILKDTFGDELAVGAGTVLTVEDVIRAKEAGAQYIISPNVNEDVIKKTKELGMVSMPGAMTPTEAVNAYDYGADIVKLFPAGLLGSGYIKAVASPINHIPFSAVGGIDVKNAKEFIDAGCIGLGVGGNLINKTYINEGRWDKITEYASQLSEAIK